MYYTWLKFDFIYFKLIITNYHTQRQKKRKFTPKIKNTKKKTLNIINPHEQSWVLIQVAWQIPEGEWDTFLEIFIYNVYGNFTKCRQDFKLILICPRSAWIAQYSQLSPCGHPAITDTPIIRTAAKSPAKINNRRLTEINSRYYGLSLMRTLTRGPHSVRNKGSWLYNV